MAQGGPGGDVIGAAMLGLAWLANPIILVGMYLLGKGARGAAAMAGTAALLLALCAAPLALIMPLALPTYLLWLASMVLVLRGANRKERPVEMEEVAQKRSLPRWPGPTGPGDKKYALIALGLYGGSYLALVLFPSLPGGPAGGGLLIILSLMSWSAAHPIGLAGMYLFATGSWRGAAIAGIAALVLALCGLPLAVFSPVASFLWLASMVLVVYRAVWQIRRSNREPALPREKLRSLEELYEDDA
jgi:hypothetical protein